MTFVRISRWLALVALVGAVVYVVAVLAVPLLDRSSDILASHPEDYARGRYGTLVHLEYAALGIALVALCVALPRGVRLRTVGVVVLVAPAALCLLLAVDPIRIASSPLSLGVVGLVLGPALVSLSAPAGRARAGLLTLSAAAVIAIGALALAPAAVAGLANLCFDVVVGAWVSTAALSRVVSTSTRPPCDRSPLREWIIATTAAETAGYAAAALLFSLPGGPWLGGGIEGTCLGLAQGFVLGRMRSRFPGFAWWAVTAAVATLGWGSTSLFGGGPDGPEPDANVMLLMAAGLGCGMGLLLGIPQAIVLGTRFSSAWRWVPSSAAAWGVGMVPAFWVATAPFGPVAGLQLALLGAAGGALMGLSVGAITGLVLVRLPPRGASRPVAA